MKPTRLADNKSEEREIHIEANSMISCEALYLLSW